MWAYHRRLMEKKDAVTTQAIRPTALRQRKRVSRGLPTAQMKRPPEGGLSVASKGSLGSSYAKHWLILFPTTGHKAQAEARGE
jgi:hypothetical protein